MVVWKFRLDTVAGLLYLPEKEVAEAHLSRSANQEIRVG